MASTKNGAIMFNSINLSRVIIVYIGLLLYGYLLAIWDPLKVNVCVVNFKK